MSEPVVVRDAVLSTCGRYRYHLARWWNGGSMLPAVFVMLNPSTADAMIDDPTIRRCVGFAQAWGLGGVVVVNLFAFRATDPTQLPSDAATAIGPDNDEHLREVIATAAEAGAPLIAAWGAHPSADRARVEHVASFDGFARAECLGMTKSGAPRHPLYVAGGTPRRPWSVTS